MGTFSGHDEGFTVEVNVSSSAHFVLDGLDVLFVFGEGPGIGEGYEELPPCAEVDLQAYIDVPFDLRLKFDWNFMPIPFTAFFPDNWPVQVEHFGLNYVCVTAAVSVLTFSRQRGSPSISV
jgi:hypothetical protein